MSNIWVVKRWYSNLNNKVLIDIFLSNFGIINIEGNGI